MRTHTEKPAGQIFYLSLTIWAKPQFLEDGTFPRYGPIMGRGGWRPWFTNREQRPSGLAKKMTFFFLYTHGPRRTGCCSSGLRGLLLSSSAGLGAAVELRPARDRPIEHGICRDEACLAPGHLPARKS
jgi:hypothetical protein